MANNEIGVIQPIQEVSNLCKQRGVTLHSDAAQAFGNLPIEIDSRNGRGLFLIYECFDDVRWSRGGNRLQLACRRYGKN